MVDPNIAMHEEIALLIAWESGKKYQARLMPIADEVEAWLRERCRAALESMTGRPVGAYDPDGELTEDGILGVPPDELFDQELILSLRPGANLPDADRQDIRIRSLFCYAVMFGGTPDTQILFIRKTNPVKLAGRSFFGSFGTQVDRIEGPVLSFDEFFDVVVTPTAIYAFNQERFEDLFKKASVVLDRVPIWVSTVFTANIPLAEGHLDAFHQRLASNKFTRRKLYSISRKEYVQALTIEHIRAGLRDLQWDEDEYIVDGMIRLTADNEKNLLALLNDDPYVGRFSQSPFIALRKQLG